MTDFVSRYIMLGFTSCYSNDLTQGEYTLCQLFLRNTVSIVCASLLILILRFGYDVSKEVCVSMAALTTFLYLAPGYYLTLVGPEMFWCLILLSFGLCFKPLNSKSKPKPHDE